MPFAKVTSPLSVHRGGIGDIGDNGSPCPSPSLAAIPLVFLLLTIDCIFARTLTVLDKSRTLPFHLCSISTLSTTKVSQLSASKQTHRINTDEQLRKTGLSLLISSLIWTRSLLTSNNSVLVLGTFNHHLDALQLNSCTQVTFVIHRNVTCSRTISLVVIGIYTRSPPARPL